MDPVKQFGHLLGLSGPGSRPSKRPPQTLNDNTMRDPPVTSQPLLWETQKPLIQGMARLSMKRKRKATNSPVAPITWGSVKALSNHGEQVLHNQGAPVNPENMFLAMAAVITCASAGTTASDDGQASGSTWLN
ncbi:periphilin-1-like [Talpa occidentalis]|uniref:periphilin-1-like n=1 Tax=Talpa occidentalis TaxID=50954 RepID=UPI00189010D4|nr:periphilin-1-like [Talpa occidentalis]